MGYENLKGQKFGRLTALEKVGTKRGYALWKCKCDCGNIVDVESRVLKTGQKKSCGCLVTKDLTDQKFGKLTPLYISHHKVKHNTLWICRCDCGNIVEKRAASLITGHTKSCGCLRKTNHAIKDITGQKFGQLTAIERTGSRYRSSIWKCKCDCGKIIEVPLYDLTCSRRVSCGCLRRNTQ